MLGTLFAFLGMSLEALVLVQGLRVKLSSRFPLFYSYLLVVLTEDCIRCIVRQWYYPLYDNVYWATQFVSLVMGSLVVFEIYRMALQEYPGAAKIARNLLGVAFLAIFARVLLSSHPRTAIEIVYAYVRLERDLRFVQTAAILSLVLLFLWYAIPFGRNLGGILVGYAVFVAISVVQLSMVSKFGPRVQLLWNIVQPFSYTFATLCWLRALWAPDTVVRLSRLRSVENDYEALARTTAALLEEARARLGSAVRP